MFFSWLPGIAASVAFALMAKWFFQSPVADALAERIRTSGRRRKHWKGLGGEWHDEPIEGAALEDSRATELDDRLTTLTAQVSELAERLDFAERLLAEKRATQLGAGR